MPICCDIQVRPVDADEYHAIDRKVMGIVFAVHNEFGRFCDERIYQNELAYRCMRDGFVAVEREVPIVVSFGTFTKTFYMDLLINHSVPYELKTANAIASEHRTQAIHYLLLVGLSHGKIVNFRPPSVQHEFVSTRITKEKRYDFRLDDQRWDGKDSESAALRSLLEQLLTEWGVFLTTELYDEAITHFLGGETTVSDKVDLVKDGRVLGSQRAHLLDSATAFRISAVTRDLRGYEVHLRRFLSHTTLTRVQWINFNRNTVEFRTIQR